MNNLERLSLTEYCDQHGLAECNVNSTLLSRPLRIETDDALDKIAFEMALGYFWNGPLARILGLHFPEEDRSDAIRNTMLFKINVAGGPACPLKLTMSDDRFGPRAYVFVDAGENDKPLLAFVSSPS